MLHTEFADLIQSHSEDVVNTWMDAVAEKETQSSTAVLYPEAEKETQSAPPPETEPN